MIYRLPFLLSFIALQPSCAQILSIEDLPPLTVDAAAAPDARQGPALAEIRLSGIAPGITLAPDVFEYTIDLPFSQRETAVTATLERSSDRLVIAGERIESGIPSAPVPLDVGDNTVTVAVERDSATTVTYRLVLRRAGRLAEYARGETSNAGADDQVGTAVALASDLLVVGAEGEASGFPDDPANDSASGSGAAYVFRRTGAVWRQEAYVKAPDPKPLDRFGCAVAAAGELVAIGAGGVEADDAIEDAGAVYLFRSEAGTWRLETRLTAPVPVEDAAFGHAIALSGDVLVVGARGEGAVYVFRRVAGRWQEEARLVPSESSAGPSYFGHSVALARDRLAIGAHWDNTGAVDAGAVYVFRRKDDAWIEETRLLPPEPVAYDEFGTSVALAEDALAVGAPGAGENDEGSVHVFRHTSGVWAHEAHLAATSPDALDEFGASVAVTGDVVVVGAPLEASAATGVDGDQDDDSASGRGAAYVFRRVAGQWRQDAYLKASSAGGPLVEFGHAVAITDEGVAVGAPRETGAATSSGAVYVFH